MTDWQPGDLAMRIAPINHCVECGNSTPHGPGALRVVERVVLADRRDGPFAPVRQEVALYLVGEINETARPSRWYLNAFCEHAGFNPSQYAKIEPLSEEDECALLRGLDIPAHA